MVFKVSIFLLGLTGAGLAMTTNSVHLFIVISADVLYSMFMPQMICTFFLPRWVNHYGACSGFVFAVVLRILIGEPAVGLPDVLPLPWDKIREDGHRFRLFPLSTATMLTTIGVILLVSRLAVWMSEKQLLKRKRDVDMDTNNPQCMEPLRTHERENETE